MPLCMSVAGTLRRGLGDPATTGYIVYMAGDCSFTIACHVDSEFIALKITLSMGDFLMVKNFNSWCG